MDFTFLQSGVIEVEEAAMLALRAQVREQVQLDERFVFHGWETVRFLVPRPELGLTSTDLGVVWGVYDFDPPFYEATFRKQDGDQIDVEFYAEEVVLVKPEPDR